MKNEEFSRTRRGARPLGDLIAALVDPIVAKKAGMNAALIQSWPEIAGVRLQEGCRPEKLIWPSRQGDDETAEPATLVVACEGAFVLRLQHETHEVLARVNAFFGYPAVAKLRIVQKPILRLRPDRKLPRAPLDTAQRRDIAEATARIDSPRLRSALERYGETVLGRNAANRNTQS
ncbi:DUF721 domain-containing protein [Aureimonas sp. AU4]|uniref:DUF721 domain-containing protein n=1 Tax=Aureimonas sp. AU4 TaxID=1638163 RepID=UPI0007808A4E|nr:DciA family protein [Aureimonas sp. AU4]